MTAYPVWFAGKPLLTSSPFVIEVTSQAGLISAEFQTTPGSWKLFPYTAAGETAASAWAGITDPGTGGSTGEGVQAPEAAAGAISGVSALIGKTGRFLDDLTSGAFWIRAGEVLCGLILLGIGVNALFKGAPMKTVTGAAGVAARVVP